MVKRLSIQRLSLILSLVFFQFSCDKKTPDAPEALFDSLIYANLKDFNRYDWQAAASLFDKDGTYANPYNHVHQQGKQLLDSVMRDVMESHKKDSLQAEIVWKTKSLVVEDSLAYQVARQQTKIMAPGHSVYEGEETMVIVWKMNKEGHWKIHYQLVYP